MHPQLESVAWFINEYGRAYHEGYEINYAGVSGAYYAIGALCNSLEEALAHIDQEVAARLDKA
jgi:hypothetical protein